MSVKSKHGAGGEYTPEWQPNQLLKSEPPPEPAPEPPQEDAPPGPARPAWRTVHKRPEKKRIAPAPAAPSTPARAPVPPPPDSPRADLPAWAQWRRMSAVLPMFAAVLISRLANPLMAPIPVHASPAIPPSPPPRSGLFGECSLQLSGNSN